MFTLDTETGFRDVVLINGAYGLGENVVQGAVDPDEFYVFKPTLAAGPPRRCCDASSGAKEVKMVYAERRHARRTSQRADRPRRSASRFCLTDDEVLELARWAMRDRGPLLQRRPADADGHRVGQGRHRPASCTSSRRGPRRWPHAEAGTAARTLPARGQRRGAGQRPGRRREDRRPGRRASSRRRRARPVPPGEVLVADMTDPDWEPMMKRAAAIVTDRGGRTCHAAIVSRELGHPGRRRHRRRDRAARATARRSRSPAPRAKPASSTPARCRSRSSASTSATLPRPRTRIMMNVGNPRPGLRARRAAQRRRRPGPHGVHHQRAHQGVHPMALLHPERVDDAAGARGDRAR